MIQMIQSQVSRRTFLKLSGMTLGVGMVAACAPVGPGAAPAGEAAPVDAPKALWAIYSEDFHPDYNDLVRKSIEDWAVANNVTLEIATTAGFVAGGADIQKMAAAVAADDAPDLWHRSGSIHQLRQLGLIVPVTELTEEIVATHGDIATRTYKEAFHDGNFYAVPHHVRSDGGWARKDIFDAAGIDITALRTFDELRDACMEVSDPGKEIWGFGMSVNKSGDGEYLVQRVVNAYGGSFVDETGQLVAIDSPETLAAVEWLVDTYTNPKWEKMLPPGILSYTDTSNNEAYLGGKLAYTQNGGTMYAKGVLDKNPVAETTIWDLPKGGPGRKDFFGLGAKNFMLMKTGKNPDTARELIKSFMSEEMLKQVYTTATTYALPAYAKMWDWTEITSVPNSIAQKAGALDPIGWNGVAFPGPSTPWADAIAAANVATDMVASVINGQASAAEAVKQAHEKAVGIFKEMGAAGTK